MVKVKVDHKAVVVHLGMDWPTVVGREIRRGWRFRTKFNLLGRAVGGVVFLLLPNHRHEKIVVKILVRNDVVVFGFLATFFVRLKTSQVWSLTQFYSVDCSKSRIDVKKCVFNKRTIKVCVSCC